MPSPVLSSSESPENTHAVGQHGVVNRNVEERHPPPSADRQAHEPPSRARPAKYLRPVPPEADVVDVHVAVRVSDERTLCEGELVLLWRDGEFARLGGVGEGRELAEKEEGGEGLEGRLVRSGRNGVIVSGVKRV